MKDDVSINKVSIQPFELLRQSKVLLGDQYWLFVGITFVGMLIGSAVPMAVLLGPMMCGIYLCYIERGQGRRVEFGQLFKGFDYFVESLLATLVTVGVSMLVVIPFYVALFIMSAVMANADAGPIALIVFMTMMFVFVILMVLISMGFIFIYLLIVDKGLKAIPAVKASMRGVFANLGGMLSLVVVVTIISMLAACFCVFPVYLFLPLALGTYYLAYRDIYSGSGKLTA